MSNVLDHYLRDSEFIPNGEIVNFDEEPHQLEDTYDFGELVTRDNFAAMVLQGQILARGTCEALSIYFSTLMELGLLLPNAVIDFLATDTKLSEEEEKMFLKAFMQVARFHKNPTAIDLVQRVKTTITHCFNEEDPEIEPVQHVEVMNYFERYMDIGNLEIGDALSSKLVTIPQIAAAIGYIADETRDTIDADNQKNS